MREELDLSTSTPALPIADPGREAMAREIFPMTMTPEEYAAREGYRWVCFSFDDYRYSDGALTEWIHRLGDILFRRNGAPSIDELRARLLPDKDTGFPIQPGR